MTYEQLAKMAEEAGFSAWAALDMHTIELKPEVRDMCATNSCGQYAKRWSCPPGCGTLEECTRKVAQYSRGILVQTVGELEDEFDGEAMMETQQLHKERFEAFCALLKGVDALKLGAGCCTVCSQCAYPDAPCRFPEKMVSSMESYGIVVAEVCKANDLPSYYGKNTIAYTSCVLF